MCAFSDVYSVFFSCVLFLFLFLFLFFGAAIKYDNIITVTSGIGITSALGVIDKLKQSRRVNLVWICRDPSWIEFFVNSVAWSKDAFIFVFYTGKETLTLGDDIHIPANIFVFQGRPILDHVISSIVHRTENELLPTDQIMEEGGTYQQADIKETIGVIVARIVADYGPQQFFEAASVTIDTEKGQQVGITQASLTAAIQKFYGVFKVSQEQMASFIKDMNQDGSGVISEKECMDFLIYHDYTVDREDESNNLNGSNQVRRGSLYGDLSHSTNSANRSMRVSEQKRRGSIGDLKTDLAIDMKHGYEEEDGIDKLMTQDFEFNKTWQMLYCGDSNTIVGILRKVSKEFKIDLRIEKFDW